MYMHMCALNTYVYMESGGFLCLNSTMGCADPPFLSKSKSCLLQMDEDKAFNPVREHRPQKHPSYSADSIHGEKAKSCIQNK